jgi:Histidine kinase
VSSYVDIGSQAARQPGSQAASKQASQQTGESGATRVFGIATRRDPATGASVISATRVIDLVRACGLVVVIITVSLASPPPSLDNARGLAIAITLGLSAVGWIAWMLSGSTGERRWLSVGGLILMAGAGGALAGLSPSSPAVAVGCAATFSAGVRLQTEASLAIVAETVAAFLVAGLAVGSPSGVLLGFPFAFAGLWSVSLTRREFLVRAEQAEHMLAETQRAREAETHAAALAERARIARDIHDVLAHSLAAVSVNLQAAEGLLASDTLPADNPELAKAVECIDRAGTLTREGLAAPSWPCAKTRRRCPISWPRWPPSTAPTATRRWISPSPAHRGRCPSRSPTWPTGRRRRG